VTKQQEKAKIGCFRNQKNGTAVETFLSCILFSLNMKQILRMQNLAKRNQLSKREVAAKSKAIEEKFLALPEFEKAKTIMLYYGVNNEVETRNLIEKALALGKRIVLPATNFEKGTMKPVELSSLDKLVETEKGLLEPKLEKEVEVEEIELVVVPGVSFDSQGGRIGRGKGFYDSLLRKTSTKIALVGLCFEENLEENIPIESHDVKMDIVITDSKVIRR